MAELIQLRDVGLPRLRQSRLPALAAAGRVVTLDEKSADHVVIEAVLRRGVGRFGGGKYGDASVALFGLDAGTRGESSRVRREIAAECFGRKYETFRKHQEPLLYADLAAQIQVLCSEQITRQARASLETASGPVQSAMPAVWLERFRAYYNIWSSLNGLGADLTAYRLTLIQSLKHYDRLIGTLEPDDPGYSQDEQAEGYATFALYHYAHFAWLLRQFTILYGGQWLLSDAEAEQAVADAVYRVWWHTPWNERDESFLRSVTADTPDQELHGFIEALRSTELGRSKEEEWLAWATGCECTWPDGTDTEDSYFPTSEHHSTISPTCDVHNLIRACGDYLDLIDADWKRLADWYHVDDKGKRGISATELIARLPAETIRSQARLGRTDS